MGTSGSKSIDGLGAEAAGGGGEAGEGGAAAEAWHGGAQLYVSLRMENARISGDLVPHVFGSEPIIGSWDPARAVRTHGPRALLLCLPRLCFPAAGMMQLLRFGFDAARDGEGASVHVAAQLRRAAGSWYVASRGCPVLWSYHYGFNWVLVFV